MKFSIIIPTLNEENNLKKLLMQLKRECIKNYEIIVADAGSKDKTIEIAKRFNCKIVKGGLPARGRNEGAKYAQGEIFLFLDADVLMSKNFLKNSLMEFKERKLDAAAYMLIPRVKNPLIKFGFNFFYNWPSLSLETIFPHGAMAILVKKEIFEKVGGFNEKIKLSEDHYFIRQCAKIGNFGILKSAKIYISLRRFEKDGWVKTVSKYLACEFYLLTGKPPTSNFFNYSFDGYSRKKKTNLLKKLFQNLFSTKD